MSQIDTENGGTAKDPAANNLGNNAYTASKITVLTWRWAPIFWFRLKLPSSLTGKVAC